MSIVTKMFRKIRRGFYWGFFYFFPVNDHRVLISNFNGNGFADSPKYIVEELKNQWPDAELIWVVKNNSIALPDYLKKCVFGSAYYYYCMSTAKVWIDNSRKIFWRKKRKQFYIQTWHGFALKKIEKDVLATLHPGYESQAKKDAHNTDLMISDSSFMTSLYRESFWYTGKVIEVGLPRYDVLIKIKPSIREKVYKYFNIKRDKDIILYAPTFRQNGSIKPYSLEHENVLEACCKLLNKECVMLVRLHPNVSDKSGFIDYNESILNATGYPDMQELLAASSIVISDYSSLMFDYMVTRRPCFIFATDIDDYKEERNFYFSLDELPFPVSRNNDELLEEILNFDKDSYQDQTASFIKKVGLIYSPDSSKKSCQEILNHVCTKS